MRWTLPDRTAEATIAAMLGPPASRTSGTLHPDAGLRGRGRAGDRGGRGHVARRHRGPPLHRRRLIAVVQRARPPSPARSTRPCGSSSAGSRTPRCSASRTRAPRSWRGGWSRCAPGGLSRVFYSDSGSTAVEVALKMAFQYWQQAADRRPSRTAFVCLENAYHGDTIGSVSVGGIDLFHSMYRPLLFDAHRVPAGDADALDAAARGARSTRSRRSWSSRSCRAPRGCCVQPPGYLRAVRELCDRHDVLPDLRRGRHRLRPHRDDVRLRAGGRRAGLPVPREGPHRRLHAARRDARHGARLRGVPGRATRSSGRSSTATPTRATRWPAPPRSRRSTCSRRSARSSASRTARSRCSSSCWRDLVAPLPARAEVRRRGFMCGIELGAASTPSPRGWATRSTLEARRRGAIVRPLGDVVVLMPPLSIEPDVLEELVEIAADSIAARPTAGRRGSLAESELPYSA